MVEIVDFYAEAAKRGYPNRIPLELKAKYLGQSEQSDDSGIEELDSRCLLDLEKVVALKRFLMDKYSFDPSIPYTQDQIAKLRNKYSDVGEMNEQELIDLVNNSQNNDYIFDIEKFMLVYVLLVEKGMVDRG